MESWKGIPASAGIKSGPARWILRAVDLDIVQNGEIMLARMTSPDWVLAFERISGIATEQGGALCHAAVVAREMNIPAVVGIGSGLREIRDGDTVEVDGQRGVVTIIARR